MTAYPVSWSLKVGVALALVLLVSFGLAMRFRPGWFVAACEDLGERQRDDLPVRCTSELVDIDGGRVWRAR